MKLSRLGLLGLVVSIAFTTNVAYAQPESMSRYPWDTRPANCLDHPKTLECAHEDWPNFDETVRRITYLYQAENFLLLERALAEITTTNPKFSSGQPALSAVYWSFRRLMPAPGINPIEGERIARWKKSFPNSYFVKFAEARFLYASAWNVRGSGYAGSVSKESWELYTERLQRSEEILLNAPQSLKDTPLWHNLLLAISLDTDQIRSDPQSVFMQAVKAWPQYYDFYEVMLTRLVPKWGGSWEQVDSFIDRWSTRQVATEGNSLYARLYISLLNQGITPDETKMNWAKMKQSFSDLIARYPDPRFKNIYASYACFARDRDAYNKVMQNLPKHLLMYDEWLSGHSYEACQRWAII